MKGVYHHVWLHNLLLLNNLHTCYHLDLRLAASASAQFLQEEILAYWSAET